MNEHFFPLTRLSSPQISTNVKTKLLSLHLLRCLKISNSLSFEENFVSSQDNTPKLHTVSIKEKTQILPCVPKMNNLSHISVEMPLTRRGDKNHDESTRGHKNKQRPAAF